jgi:hypothetical protein
MITDTYLTTFFLHFPRKKRKKEEDRNEDAPHIEDMWEKLLYFTIFFE